MPIVVAIIVAAIKVGTKNIAFNLINYFYVDVYISNRIKNRNRLY